MIILEDLLGTINSAEGVTIDLRNEETGVSIDRWYGLPSSLLTLEGVRDLRRAVVDEIEVDDSGEILITIR